MEDKIIKCLLQHMKQKETGGEVYADMGNDAVESRGIWHTHC